ncbi:MAG: glycosyltransferase family 2 protein [Chitinophagales bacterium]
MTHHLSIIIVNYKSTALLLNCLKTIYTETDRVSFEIIVVDNHSEDQSKDQLLTAFPNLKWIQMSYNTGFARANNEGIKQSVGDLVLLLNPDTLIEGHAIDGCCEKFVDSQYVACGVQLINPDRTPQISGNYFTMGGLNYLLPLPFLGSLIKWLGKIFAAKIPHVEDSGSLTEVDWINGAFLMVKKDAIRQAGLLDEDFFLYAEEAEWCSRLGKIGRLCIFGSIKVVHLQGETAGSTFGFTGKGYSNLFNRQGLQIMLSNMLRIRKQFGVFWFLFQLFIYSLDIPIFLIGLILSAPFSKSIKSYSFHQFGPFAKNVFYIWAQSPTIIMKNPHFYKVL